MNVVYASVLEADNDVTVNHCPFPTGPSDIKVFLRYLHIFFSTVYLFIIVH